MWERLVRVLLPFSSANDIKFIIFDGYELKCFELALYFRESDPMLMRAQRFKDSK